MAANFRLNALLWRWILAEPVTYALAVSRPHFLAAGFRTNTPITSGGSDDSLEASTSAICFFVNLTISIFATVKSFPDAIRSARRAGDPTTHLADDPRRHRAEGLVSLSSLTGQTA